MRLWLPFLGVLSITSVLQAQDLSPELPNSSVEFGNVTFNDGVYQFTKVRMVSEQREESYTVNVPYSEENDAGVVTKMRTETRTRVISVPIAIQETMTFNAEDVVLASAAGASVKDPKMIARVLAKPRPAVLTQTHPPLDKFYAKLFKPNVIVLHVKPTRKPVGASDTAPAPPTPPAPGSASEAPPSPEDPPSPAPNPVPLESKDTFDDLFGTLIPTSTIG